MAPHQAGPNTGASEGDRAVRLFDDPIWSYPAVSELLKVTITPVPMQ